MGRDYVIYCDESGHLENDGLNSMSLGAVWCSTDAKDGIKKRIDEIKRRHSLSKNFEIKWTKISPSKLQFYIDIVDYFFDDDDMHFRGVAIPDKNCLDHKKYNNTHDKWYYIMYFNLLKVIIENSNRYKIFLDIKDTNGGKKVDSLHSVLSNSVYDFDRNVIRQIQLIRSHESSILQIADLLSGALMAANKNNSDNTSPAKYALIQRIRERSGYALTKSTLYREQKFNLLIWSGSNYSSQGES